MALRVVAYTPDASSATDLTQVAEGLRWSNVNPGGDETASFTVKRSWFSDSPDLKKGNLLRVLDGLDVLFQGRIDELDPTAQDNEAIGVTAYGLGIRLKDNTDFVQVFVDCLASSWGDMPLNEKLRLVAAGLSIGDFSWTQDAGGLFCALPNQALGAQTDAETWYVAPSGETIVAVQLAVGVTSTIFASGYTNGLNATDVDDASTRDSYALTTDGALHTLALSVPRRFLYLFCYSNGTATMPPAGANIRASLVAVVGNHGLTTIPISGGTDGVGGDDVINYVVGQVDGVVARRVDSTDQFVIPQLVFATPVTRRDVVDAVNAFYGYDHGVWGPDSALDLSFQGYMDFKQRDTATRHWVTRRADCENLQLHTELSTLFDTINVTYTDPATGRQEITTVSATVPALLEAGMSPKVEHLDGGDMTLAGAQELATVAIALADGEVPARGSFTIKQQIKHYQRGMLQPHYMRADGSNVAIPDVLPASDQISLSSAPDRESTFPVKRVTVDASGNVPAATVEVDQSNDLLTVLQARLALAAQTARPVYAKV